MCHIAFEIPNEVLYDTKMSKADDNRKTVAGRRLLTVMLFALMYSLYSTAHVMGYRYLAGKLPGLYVRQMRRLLFMKKTLISALEV